MTEVPICPAGSALILALVLLLGTSVLSLFEVRAATYTVNSNDPGDGVCDATECTLREAINEANRDCPTQHSITFSVSGTIKLDPAHGSLSLECPMIIDGGNKIPYRATSMGTARRMWPVHSIYGHGAIPQERTRISRAPRDQRQHHARGFKYEDISEDKLNTYIEFYKFFKKYLEERRWFIAWRLLELRGVKAER